MSIIGGNVLLISHYQIALITWIWFEKNGKLQEYAARTFSKNEEKKKDLKTVIFKTDSLTKHTQTLKHALETYLKKIGSSFEI